MLKQNVNRHYRLTPCFVQLYGPKGQILTISKQNLRCQGTKKIIMLLYSNSFFYSRNRSGSPDGPIQIKIISSRIREPALVHARIRLHSFVFSEGVRWPQFVARDDDDGDGVEYISKPAGREGGCPPSFKQRYTLLSPRWEGPLFPALMFSQAWW